MFIYLLFQLQVFWERGWVMLINMLGFELKYYFRQITFKAAALLFFVLGMLAVQGSYGGEQVHKNAPYVITTIVGLLSMSSVFLSAVLCAGVVMRDGTCKMDAILFATSVSRFSYFTVRFTGLLLSVFFILCLAVAGLFAGSFFLDSSARGPFEFLLFCQPLIVFGLPNILFSAALIYCTGLLTANTRAVYVSGLMLYILYLTASILGNSPLFATSSLKLLSPDDLSFLLDPFGLASFFSTTRTWTDHQRNTLLFPLTKDFLLNRLLWSAAALLILTTTYRYFTFGIRLPEPSSKKWKPEPSGKTTAYCRFQVYPFGRKYFTAAFSSQLKLELTSVFKHIPFLVMLFLWIFIFTIELKDSLFSGPYGIGFYPATGIIIGELISVRPALVLLIFYAAELLWRERTDRFEELVYSTPVSATAMWVAKSSALVCLCAVLITANIFIGIGIQISQGYFDLELSTYFSLYYYCGVPLAFFTLLFVFIQTVTADKYLGMLLSMTAAFVIIFSRRLGFEHYLLRFGSAPQPQYSYMNGFGHYAKAFDWYMIYWAACSGFVSILAICFWQKNKAGDRFKITNLLKNKPRSSVLAAFLLIWISAGAYIFYQTNIQGHYKSKADKIVWQILYEKKYKSLSAQPQPVIQSVKTSVALYPLQGRYTVSGTYILKNESGSEIGKIWSGIDPQVSSATISLSKPARQTRDPEFGQHWFYLEEPLPAGAEIKMDFKLDVQRSSFTAFNAENSVVENGSYIELEKYVPFLGYNSGFETSDLNARKQHGLKPRQVESAQELRYHLIDFETTVSTDFDQCIVTTGVLQSSWTENKRRFFHYKTRQPSGFMFALSSARYLIKKEKYKNINLIIYYQKRQEQNLPSILKAMKNTIDYCSENFAPYPLPDLTLAEIPDYNGAATAYPGVVFSAEKISFLGDFSDTAKINQSYAITAHEVSHQWWANILAAAPGPGRSFLTESLAKYTEAMVLRKQYGKQHLSTYLQAENNLYFALRSSDGKELPLLAATDQPFVYYQKGALVMNTLKEVLGEKRLNQALSEMIKKHRAPFPKARPEDFLNELYAAASESQKRLISELLTKVITFDLKPEVISCNKMPNGKFKLTLKLHIEKIDNDLPAPIALNEQIGIAVFDQLQNQRTGIKPVFKQTFYLGKKDTVLTLTLDKRPKAVQIDPDGLMLDKDPTDNMQLIGN